MPARDPIFWHVAKCAKKACFSIPAEKYFATKRGRRKEGKRQLMHVGKPV